MSPVIVARRLSVGYGSRVVLEDVDTFLQPGGSVALVGSNGSGKSTLLKTFAGLLPALDGDSRSSARRLVVRRPTSPTSASTTAKDSLSRFERSTSCAWPVSTNVVGWPVVDAKTTRPWPRP